MISGSHEEKHWFKFGHSKSVSADKLNAVFVLLLKHTLYTIEPEVYMCGYTCYEVIISSGQ